MSQAALDLLDDVHRLMQLRGENPFKVRAFEKARAALEGHTDLLERAKAGTLTELPGIGKSIAELLTDFLLHGKTTVRDELQAALPPGLEELTRVPGLGPKKALGLIEELGIASLAELEYACRENRLLKLKGFGEKLQHKILEGIQFLKTTQGKLRIVDAEPEHDRVRAALEPALGGARIEDVGEFRRRLEVVSAFEFLIEAPEATAAAQKLQATAAAALEKVTTAAKVGVPVKLHYSPRARFGYEQARLTASAEHWAALGQPAARDYADEAAFYRDLKLTLLPPETRETGEEVKLARAGNFPELLPENGLQGIFHNHTTRSDGSNSLEEMVTAAEKLGFRYIGISDHSKSAFYAQGLDGAQLKAQAQEVEDVQARHPKIRIFWGIESDILADGALDYDAETIARFDFVIASVHSRFQMDRETMTLRIIEALRHPKTRFLGHATGRLLLGRAGYDIDMERIIAEAAKNNVAIEINAHPARLDIDWRWGPRLRAHKTLVSVNPDAHETAGLEDTRFGVTVARKALLPASQVLNSWDVDRVAAWLARK